MLVVEGLKAHQGVVAEEDTYDGLPYKVPNCDSQTALTTTALLNLVFNLLQYPVFTTRYLGLR